MQKPDHIVSPDEDLSEFIKQDAVKVGHLINVIGERRESERLYRVIEGLDGMKDLEEVYLGFGGVRRRSKGRKTRGRKTRGRKTRGRRKTKQNPRSRV